MTPATEYAIVCAMPTPTYRIMDVRLDGQLASMLGAWRTADLSFDAIADTLLDMTGERVNGETIRRWCTDLGIAA